MLSMDKRSSAAGDADDALTRGLDDSAVGIALGGEAKTDSDREAEGVGLMSWGAECLPKTLPER